jgi:hypothetical protein
MELLLCILLVCICENRSLRVAAAMAEPVRTERDLFRGNWYYTTRLFYILTRFWLQIFSWLHPRAHMALVAEELYYVTPMYTAETPDVQKVVADLTRGRCQVLVGETTPMHGLPDEFALELHAAGVPTTQGVEQDRNRVLTMTPSRARPR